jgi:hypothetical protein
MNVAAFPDEAAFIMNIVRASPSDIFLRGVKGAPTDCRLLTNLYLIVSQQDECLTISALVTKVGVKGIRFLQSSTE